MNAKISSFKDLIVWQKSIDLVVKIYELTANFPQEEKYNLTSQLRRAAVSIPSNIAEGTKRVTRKDYVNFLRIALGSLAELETQLEIAQRLALIEDKDISSLMDLIIEVQKMLNTIIRKLS